ncbi:glycoside hydrolase family protein [Aquimarina agarilytica]|uniref:glycoside hydrolase family protein n=1 Tax=Aquimarina agarilytica TaxID=1087449 RepID=UPI000289871A|nr:glycoside hydrolase family protein [Aquimarina agarilytica]
MKSSQYRKLLPVFLFAILNITAQNHSKSLIDFFEPIPSKPKKASKVWGDSAVISRDPNNGLEDTSLKNWCYWDGKIVKDHKGKFHMYASRWNQESSHHDGWTKNSKGCHAVSNHLLGPYKDKGETWPQWHNGKGHNVVGLRMHDGRYATISSEITSGQVFVSDTPNGPFKLLGDLKIDPNGFYRGLGRYDELDDGALRGGGIGRLANVMIFLKPNGQYMLLARHCVPMLSNSGILGPYKMMSDKAWKGVDGIPQFKMEDPTIWYSNNLYHIVVNHYGDDTTYHLTSEDGLHNWQNRGIAFKKDQSIFRYDDGTTINWYTVQRPTVYTDGETVKAFNFSVIDVHKGRDNGNDNHGSKIVVVPFNGKAFAEYMNTLVQQEHTTTDATPVPSSWDSKDIGAVHIEGNSGFNEKLNTFRIKSSGHDLEGKKDAFRYVYQKIDGDVSLKTQILSQDISTVSTNAGLMIRADLDDNAPFVALSISSQGKLSFSKRETLGTAVVQLKQLDIHSPYWLRLERRENIISAWISSSNRYNWTKVGETTLNTTQPIYAGLCAANTTNTAESISRFKDVDLHSWGTPLKEGFTAHTFPDTIPTSGKINFDVDYEAQQSLDIFVELQNVETLKKYKVLRKRLKRKGTIQLVYDAGESLPPKSSFWLVLKAIPMHAHDSEAIQSSFKKVFTD